MLTSHRSSPKPGQERAHRQAALLEALAPSLTGWAPQAARRAQPRCPYTKRSYSAFGGSAGQKNDLEPLALEVAPHTPFVRANATRPQQSVDMRAICGGIPTTGDSAPSRPM